ncbi:MAG TPA: ferritin-like domain-containing protein [Planctomycetota bacterium]|jgi:bacterioferritin
MANTEKNAVVEVLNKARSSELAAILQYMSQHYELADRDYGQIAAQFKLIAIDEMRHAEMLAERVLLIGGVPTSRPDMEIKKKQSLAEIVAQAVAAEETALRDYNEFLHVCQKNNDYASGKIFELLITEEQLHLEYFQDIQDHIKELGNAYLATQVGGPAEAGAPPKGFVASQGGAA